MSVAELFPKARKLSYDVHSQFTQLKANVIQPSALLFSLDELVSNVP
jgi:hypothetical protein